MKEEWEGKLKITCNRVIFCGRFRQWGGKRTKPKKVKLLCAGGTGCVP